ncbi:MAG: hypothetical protein WCL27_01410 [Betaproteobacteria bacterium]
MHHLFVDISSHGFGHLAQAAPILNELCKLLPGLRLSVRSGLPLDKLRSRLHGNFTHLLERSDFGFIMVDATRIDFSATAAAYQTQHRNWQQRVDAEAAFLSGLQPGLVLTDVAYLPLAGAAQAGIPSLSMCSLNWADLLAYFFSHETWATPVHREMLAAYNSATCFLRLIPGMPMSDLSDVRDMPPVAALGQDCRAALRTRLGCSTGERLVLVAFGGIHKQLPVENWPSSQNVRWLIPQSWDVVRDDMAAIEPLSLHFTDLLCSVDAVLTKPGYGTFTEAACNGTAVLYQRRDDWPEQECLIDWLKLNARCHEVTENELLRGDLDQALNDLWKQARPPVPRPNGAAEAAEFILARLTAENRSA